MPYFVTHSSKDEHSWSITAPNMKELRAFGSPQRLSRGDPLSIEDLARLRGTEYLVRSRYAKFPPDAAGPGNPFYLSERTFAIVKSFEPSLHDIPVRFISKKSGERFGTWYELHLPIFADCIDVDRTEFQHGYGREAAEKSDYDLPLLRGHYTLRRSAIANLHIWRPRPPGRGSICFISDDLHGGLTDAGVTGWEYNRCELSD